MHYFTRLYGENRTCYGVDPNTRPQGESFDMATESINAVLRALNLKVTNKTNIFILLMMIVLWGIRPVESVYGDN